MVCGFANTIMNSYRLYSVTKLALVFKLICYHIQIKNVFNDNIILLLLLFVIYIMQLLSDFKKLLRMTLWKSTGFTIVRVMPSCTS